MTQTGAEDCFDRGLEVSHFGFYKALSRLHSRHVPTVGLDGLADPTVSARTNGFNHSLAGVL